MARLVDVFCDRHTENTSPYTNYVYEKRRFVLPVGASHKSMSTYGAEIRKCLERMNYLATSPHNELDRRVLPLCPTTRFPSKLSKKQLDKLTTLVCNYVITRMSDRRRSQRMRNKRKARNK